MTRNVSSLLTTLVLHGILASTLVKSTKVTGRADIDLGPVDYQCPEGVNVAPHEIQCELYYICGSGAIPTHLYHCVDDQLFDLEYYGCNYKELVDCGDRLKPFKCPTPDGKFPIKENACDSHYYICLNNNATLEECPGGGIYQQDTQTCAAPGAVICPTSTPKASTTARPTPGQFVCPEPDGTFPSPWSCEQYYVCVSSTPFLYYCPSGLYFNPKNGNCDWPYNVDCNIPQ